MTLRVAVLAYDGCLAAELFGFAETLLLANRIAAALDGDAAPPFDIRIVTVGGSAVRSAGGAGLVAAGRLRKADLLVVPGFDFGRLRDLDDKLAGWHAEIGLIARAFKRGMPVASICVGAFLLGAAGVLDGRRAATAWLFAAELQKRYPAAQVQPTALLIDDGGVTTTGAFTAAFDLALSLSRQTAGAKISGRLRKLALLAQERTSQLPFVDRDMLPGRSGSFASQVQQWLARRVAEPYDLGRLAAQFHVSARTMLRRFKAETGQTPLDCLHDLRIGKAKALLENTGRSVAQIGLQVGYQDESSFRVLFARHVGMTPASYRRQFRAAPLR